VYRDPAGGARWLIAFFGSMVFVFLGSYAVGYYGEYVLIAIVGAVGGFIAWRILRKRRRRSS
jgi:uncharacterized membrane protein YfcA